MIEIGKEYSTRNQRKVKIYTIEGGGDYPVHGAIWQHGNYWRPERWTAEGMYFTSPGPTPCALDLFEVIPRIKRSIWVNVYDDIYPGAHFPTKASADQGAGHGRIACVKLKIDCAKGEGL